MAKGNINPAFQAAPFLGESSYNPIAFQQRHKMIKYQREMQRQEEIEERTAKGLEKLMVDIKSWEDQEGFKEIMADHDKVINGFLAMSKKGLNLVSPKTSQEIMGYKAVQDALNGVKQKVDVWNRQKGVYDLITQAIKQESLKPEDQRRIDTEEVRNNLYKAMEGKSVLDRDISLDKLLVFKPEPGDMWKLLKDNAGNFPKMGTKTIEQFNEETGRVETTTIPYLDAEQRELFEDTARGVYRTAKDRDKKSVIMNFEQYKKDNPDSKLSMTSPEDFFVEMAKPKEARRYVSGLKGGGGGFNISFLGQKANMPPGRIVNPIVYGTGESGRTYSSPYEFQDTKPINVNWTDPTDITKFAGQKWRPVGKTGNVRAQLLYYDPERDELIFRSTQTGNEPYLENNTVFAVPRKFKGNQADELKIEKDGKIMTLGEAFPMSEEPVKKKLSISWDLSVKKPMNFVEKK